MYFLQVIKMLVMMLLAYVVCLLPLTIKLTFLGELEKVFQYFHFVHFFLNVDTYILIYKGVSKSIGTNFITAKSKLIKLIFVVYFG